MKAVILEVRSPAEVMAAFPAAWKSRKSQKVARISFATPELLWRVLTARRWELLKALLAAGVLNRAKGGGVEFPFEAVKVEFLLQTA